MNSENDPFGSDDPNVPRALGWRGRPPRQAFEAVTGADTYSVSRLSTIVGMVERKVELLHRSVEQINNEIDRVWYELDSTRRPLAQSRRPAGISLAALTRQERRIALWTADGMSNNEMAAELKITAGTVKSHLKGVFRKLGVHSRWELAYLLSPHGWTAGSSLQSAGEGRFDDLTADAEVAHG